MPSVRTGFSPTSFHQDNETGNRTIAPVRDTHYSLSTRHADYGPESRNGQMPCSNNNKPPRKSGVYCQLSEVSSNTFNNNRISGISCRLKNLDFISSKGKDKESQEGMSSNSGQSTALNSTTFPTFWLPNLHHSRSLSCSNSFSVLTNRQKQGLEHLPRLLSNTQPTGKGRTYLVEGQFESLEWESPSFRGNRPNYRNRCLPQRVGASCMGQTTGVRWSLQEQYLHINCLELLAGAFALKAFTKDKAQMRVRLLMDNTSAAHYINKMGGTRSLILASLAQNLWERCLERQIVLEAQHIPGIVNIEADRESRIFVDNNDWKLAPQFFDNLNHVWGALVVDLFATRLSKQLPRFVSWRPGPEDTLMQRISQCMG